MPRMDVRQLRCAILFTNNATLRMTRTNQFDDLNRSKEAFPVLRLLSLSFINSLHEAGVPGREFYTEQNHSAFALPLRALAKINSTFQNTGFRCKPIGCDFCMSNPHYPAHIFWHDCCCCCNGKREMPLRQTRKNPMAQPKGSQRFPAGAKVGYRELTGPIGT